MIERHRVTLQRRVRHLLPWLWIIGPAYLVALAIALLTEADAPGGRGIVDLLSKAE